MTTLQIIWFLLIGVLLTGYAILDGFDLGVGFWHLFTKKEAERSAFIKSISPVWDGNEVWLLTGGGAIFAAFPPVYASVFSGFYLALILVLMGLILRVVAIEFRHQVDSRSWKAKWDLAFALGSILPGLLFGVALGNIVRGVPLDSSGNYIGGFFGLLNPYSLCVGLTGLAMFATHGALYLSLKTEGELQEQSLVWSSRAWLVYLVLFIVVSAWSIGVYASDSMVLPLVFVVLALLSIIGIKRFNNAANRGKSFIASSLSIASIFAAVGSSIFPNMVKATNGEGLSLTVYNASASQNTLTVMLILAVLGMPLVIGYTIFIYRLFAGPVNVESEEGGY